MSKLEASIVAFLSCGLLVASYAVDLCAKHETPMWPGVLYILSAGLAAGLIGGCALYVALVAAEKKDG